MELRHLNSKIKLGDTFQNIGELFLRNRDLFGENNGFAERDGDHYKYWSWNQIVEDILQFSTYLADQGLTKGQRVALVSTNSYTRYISEMAVMCSGLISVPIFYGYPYKKLEKLINFADVSLVIMEDEIKWEQLNVTAPCLSFTKVTNILKTSEYSLEHLNKTAELFKTIQADSTLLIMFTSGTTRFPKGVMLTHKNILSQQKSIEILWKLENGRNFLCYLPWHHSFGGLFERFLTVYNAGCLAIDDSMAKDINRLFENFNLIKPDIYFSVPQVYQQIAGKVLTSIESEQIFFHSNLKFVFTAAAPLPLSTSNVFKEHKVPVIEGWGLTETSPCCTLTEQSLDRTAGIVGFPIPEVEIKLSPENEILIKGPNVMLGYFNNPEETEKVFDKDSWFKTGDVGNISSEGLKIISRIDRIFKLTNAEKVYPVEIEERIRKKCNFIEHIYILGSGEPAPIALIFPNYELLKVHDQEPKASSCALPQEINCFQNCFHKCLKESNLEMQIKFERVKKAVIINRSLSMENGELTPSMKLVPRIIEENYKKYIDCLKTNKFDDLPSDGFVINLE